MSARFYLLAYIIALLAAPASAEKPCFGRLNSTFAFEEVCYKLLHNGSDGLQLREYAAGAGGGAAATLVTHSAGSAITVYQEALEITGYDVIDYFIRQSNAANKSLLASRTVPLALRPPSAANPEWLGFMALAPSQWPPGKAPPKPLFGVALEPLGGRGGKEAVLLAVQLASSDAGMPQPADFDALCARLRAAVAAQLPVYRVDDKSSFSPTHARYYGEMWIGEYDYECWLGVTKA